MIKPISLVSQFLHFIRRYRVISTLRDAFVEASFIDSRVPDGLAESIIVSLFIIIDHEIIVRVKTCIRLCYRSIFYRASLDPHHYSLVRFFSLLQPLLRLPHSFFTSPTLILLIFLHWHRRAPPVETGRWMSGRDRGTHIYSQERTPRVHRYLAPRAVT